MSGKVSTSEKIARNADSEDLTDDIVSVSGYAFSVPPKKEFKPWHRPRKQFVRNDQWLFYVTELVSERSPFDGPLTYFGLPGADLLDIRFFDKMVCDQNNVKLRFLGFDLGAAPDSETASEFIISRDEVSKLASIDPQSDVIAHDIRELSNEDSIAWQKTLEYGPYDVVNLDLCDGITKEEGGNINDTYYNAVSRLLTVQSRRKSPWLLFLTTRVGKRHIHDDALEKLCRLYLKNLADCAPFREQSKAKFSIENETGFDLAKSDDQGLQRIVLTGLCKWLLGLTLGQQPPTVMEVKSLFGYRVRQGASAEDMVSIAIRFQPTHVPPNDPIQLAVAKAAAPDECVLAEKAAVRVSTLVDVDDVLASDPNVRSEMTEAMCSLLESARYDINAYRKWAATA
ncbi:hypothetical protein [Mesorhizobium sp.]|uniref:PP_RS20740 family protein n=1 Tax=Mesorhizobium sp. TaxID=1871066 RepID=UPI0025F0044B|nr:hypothetical protein [Mesorhizobium sp.]